MSHLNDWLGLLEAIPDAAILANADPDDKDGDGISGRPNWVWDDEQQTVVMGRFGWKAGQPNLNQQNVHAFSGDMGLTTSLRNFDDCTPTQTDCLAAPNGNGPDGEPEVSDNILRLVLFYSRTRVFLPVVILKPTGTGRQESVLRGWLPAMPYTAVQDTP